MTFASSTTFKCMTTRTSTRDQGTHRHAHVGWATKADRVARSLSMCGDRGDSEKPSGQQQQQGGQGQVQEDRKSGGGVLA
jgi:hypothetical protein